MDRFNYEQIKNYQSFTTIEEMDQTVRGFLYEHKASLSEGTVNVLHFIWRHSVKVIGVSFAKYVTIAEGIKISRRTVIRAVKKLESLGIIKKIPTTRMNGKQGVNLLVIQPFQTKNQVKPNMSPHDATLPVTANKTKNNQRSLCENKNKHNYVRGPKKCKEHQDNKTEQAYTIDVEQLDTSFIPDFVPEEFVHVAKPFFSAMEIYKLWKCVVIAYYKTKLERHLNDVMDTVIRAFKQSVFMKKVKKLRSTFNGYFYGTVYGMLLVEKRRENKHLLYDFIRNDSLVTM